MLVTQLLNEEVTLLLSSFLHPLECRKLRNVASGVLSQRSSPRTLRALSWRQTLGEMCVLVEVILGSQSQELMLLSDFLAAFATLYGSAGSALRLEQFLAAATKLVSLHESPGGPALGRVGHETAMHVPGCKEYLAFSSLLDRCCQFDASLARQSEWLATQTEESMPARPVEPEPMPPETKKRRLSRTRSIALPDECIQAPGLQITAYIKARNAEIDFSRWSSQVVHGAESARAVLQCLHCKGGTITMERLERHLCALQSIYRPLKSHPVAKASIPAVLLYLLTRTSGGVVPTALLPGQLPLDLFSEASLSSMKSSLDRLKCAMKDRHMHLEANVRRAFRDMIPTGSSNIYDDDDAEKIVEAARHAKSLKRVRSDR